MMPIGLLMIEHRLIERIVPLLEDEKDHLQEGRPPEVGLLESAIDFFRTYADRCHHGKEEDILFAELGEKELSQQHQAILDELLQEHEQAREAVRELSEGLKPGGSSNPDRDKIERSLQTLIRLYPEHITKEDKQFFIPCTDYLSEEEQSSMIEKFREFDQELIHEKYKKLMERFEARYTSC